MTKNQNFVKKPEGRRGIKTILDGNEAVSDFYGYSSRRYYDRISKGEVFLTPVSETENTRQIQGQLDGGKVYQVVLPKGTKKAALISANTICPTQLHYKQPYRAILEMIDERPGSVRIVCCGDYGLSSWQTLQPY